MVSGIYASPSHVSRLALWEEIKCCSNANLPWLCAGDFNVCLNKDDKLGGKVFQFDRSVRDFGACVHASGLLDLGFSGSAFTWCNNQAGLARIWSRIDRAFANSSFLNVFPYATVKHLVRTASDHCPLLVGLSHAGHRRGGLFRFEHFWFQYEKVNDLVSEAFSTTSSLSASLCKVKHSVSKWNKTDLGRLESNLDRVRKDIELLEQSDYATVERRGLTC